MSCLGSGTVSVIKTASNIVTHTIPVGIRPLELTAAPDGSRVYVARSGGDVAVILTRDKTVHVLSAGGPVNGPALTPDGRRLYLAMLQEGLKRLDTATGLVTRLASSPCPAHLAVTPDGRRLYVNYQCSGPGGRPGHDAIDVFELPAERLVASITGLPNVGGPMAVSPEGAQVWANGLNACYVPAYDHAGCPVVPGSVLHIIRTSDNAVLRTLALPGEAFDRISFSPGGARVGVGRRSTSLGVLDTASFTLLESLQVRASGSAVFTPDGKRAYAVLFDKSALAVFEAVPETSGREVPGLVARWPADGTANDTRGIRHGRLEGGAGFVPGCVGQAFLFDGRQGSVSIGFSPLTTGIQDEFTVAAWAKFTTTGAAEMSILDTCRGAEFQPAWRLFKRNDNRLAFCLGGQSPNGCADSATAVSRRAVIPGEWFHIATVRSLHALSLYVNGALEAVNEAAPFRGHSAEGVSELRLGSSALSGAFLHGRVDEVKFYNRALSASEILSIYQTGSAAGCREQ